MICSELLLEFGSTPWINPPNTTRKWHSFYCEKTISTWQFIYMLPRNTKEKHEMRDTQSTEAQIGKLKLNCKQKKRDLKRRDWKKQEIFEKHMWLETHTSNKFLEKVSFYSYHRCQLSVHWSREVCEGSSSVNDGLNVGRNNNCSTHNNLLKGHNVCLSAFIC